MPEPPHDLGVGEEECVANDWTWTSYSCGDAADYWRSRVEADAASECTDFFHHHEGPHGERCCTSYPENADDRMCSSMGDDCCACDASIGQYDCEWEEAATCRGGYVPKITYGSDEGRHHHPPCEYSCYHPCTSSEEECWGWLWEMCPAEMDWCHSADPTMDPCWSIIERAANTSVSGGNMTEVEAEIAANELASSVGACVERTTSHTDTTAARCSEGYVPEWDRSHDGFACCTEDFCSDGQICFEGVLCLMPCRSNWDCPSDQYCFWSSEEGLCYPGEYCAEDHDAVDGACPGPLNAPTLCSTAALYGSV